MHINISSLPIATVSVTILNTIIFAEENNPVRQYDSKLPCRIRGSEDEVSKVLVCIKHKMNIE